MFGTRVDVLSQGDSYDLVTRTPTKNPAEEVEETIEEEVDQLQAS
jgi:hypothetical protein